MAADEPLRYRRLRAPAEDQTALIEPPLAEIPALVARNQELAKNWDHLSGVPFAELQRRGREGMMWWIEGPGSKSDNPFIATGHQPTLYHPGVWLKNFLLAEVSQRVSGQAINLIVDNDVIRSPSIRVPTGTADVPRTQDIPFDISTEEMPWEERAILDRSLFDTFAARVLAAHSPLRIASNTPAEPLLIEHLWQHSHRLVNESQMSLSDLLSCARLAVEEAHGLKSSLFPIGELCLDAAWYEFLSIILERTAEFHSVYNTALAQYRTINHIRSRQHPVPDLLREGDWLEVPFWIWQADQPQRKRLFAHSAGKSWAVRSVSGLPLSGEEVWKRGILSNEIRIRPRALITTMYARLVLSDLFLHGIGGAKYDEVTDAIIRRFFGIEPPGYVTATATVRLPLERPRVTPEDLAALDQKYRDTIHHPEVFLDDYSGHHQTEFAALVKQKHELITHRWQEKQKKVWHDRVSSANERMSSLLEPIREQLRHQREKLVADLHRARILGSREYSFCLFPEEMLVPLLKKMAGIQS
jgi:hypothetical protein